MIYHLGAQSHVRVSFDIPEYTFDITGTVRLLEAIREAGEPRFYQASSSEMFGAAPPPQNEETPFHPRSPGGVAKVAAHWATSTTARPTTCSGVNAILFNHESPRAARPSYPQDHPRRRPDCRGAPGQALPRQPRRGGLGLCPDFVEAMWLMLQAEEPEDFVIATGETHTVREVVEIAFARADLDWEPYVEIDPKYYRPSEVDVCSAMLRRPRRSSVGAHGALPRAGRADGRRGRRRARGSAGGQGDPLQPRGA